MMRFMNRLFLLVCVLGASAVGAEAQSAPAAPPPGQLVVERIESSWLVAPDARVADLDGRTGSLAGAYAGRITDRTWLIGGGGYWWRPHAARCGFCHAADDAHRGRFALA